MPGEVLALLAALAYGAAGLSIVMGKAGARGDNGVFLSVLVTAAVLSVVAFPMAAGALRGAPAPVSEPSDSP